MHTNLLKRLLIANLPLKLTSLMLGYLFWSMLSSSHTASYWLTVPLCFYNNPIATTINAPESIMVNLSGTRTDLWNIDPHALAVHVDLKDASFGKQALTLTTHDLLLPKTIRLVHYKPSNIVINIIRETDSS